MMFPGNRKIASLLFGLTFLVTPAFAADTPKAVRSCVACHTFDKGGPSKIGPNLFGVVGKPAASDANFAKYGEDFLAAAGTGLTWTDDTLDAYIADPVPFLRKVTGKASVRTYMITRIRRADERAEIIDYLKSLKD
jgi:cytochrome c